MLRSTLVSLAISTALATSCTTNPALSDADLSAVRGSFNALVEAEDVDDWDQMENRLTEDFINLTPRTEPTRGREEWRAWVDASAVQNVDISYTIVDVGGSGDMAYVMWTYTGTWIEDGAEVTAPGKGISIFQRQSDGTWLQSRNAWIEDTAGSDG